MKCNILGKRLVKKCFKIMWNKKKKSEDINQIWLRKAEM